MAHLALWMTVVMFCIGIYFDLSLGLAVAVAVVGLIMGSRQIRKRSTILTRRFIANLSAREQEAKKHRSVGPAFRMYDLHLADFELDPRSSFCGCRLMNLDLRRSCGINVVRIVRGGVGIDAPGGRECLYPHDRIIVAGSDEEIRRFGSTLEASVAAGRTTMDPPSDTILGEGDTLILAGETEKIKSLLSAGRPPSFHAGRPPPR